MAIFTPWGSKNNPTPIRSWINQNIPGAKAIGDVLGSQKIVNLPGVPTFGQLNQQVRGISQTKAQAPTKSAAKTNISKEFFVPGPPAGYSNQPTGQSLGVQQSSGGGQPTPSGNQSNFSVNDVLQPEPQAPQIDFDALIAPALQGLEEAIAPMQQEFTNTQTDIEAGKTSKTAKAKQEFSEQEGVIGQARTGQTQQAESAVDEARRQFGELQQGIQSRYGGTTGTGRFASEIAGGQTFRNIANIRQNLSQVVAGLDDKLVQVKEIGRIALQDIQDQGDQQIRDAKNKLDTALADIRRQKGEIQSRKAELASNAIQWYQGEVNRVKQENAQFLQSLTLQQQKAEQELNLAMQKAKSAGSNLPSADYNAYNINNQPFILNKRTGEGSFSTGAPAFGTDEENPALAGGNASGLSPEERKILGL